jgi:PIN domain nuclease of toxin-antitoxin system
VYQGLEEVVIAYLDTHVAVWLHAGLVERLSSQARNLIEANDLLISPMVLLEFQYLYERKRIAVAPVTLYSDLTSAFGVLLCNFPFPAVAMEALTATWTSDPFDRIIVAHAKANREAPLITADTAIRRHYPHAMW